MCLRPCAIRCRATIATPEPCKVHGRNLYHQNGRVVLDKMTQKRPCAIFIVEVIYDFQRSKLTWTDFSMLMHSSCIHGYMYTYSPVMS